MTPERAKEIKELLFPKELVDARQFMMEKGAADEENPAAQLAHHLGNFAASTKAELENLASGRSSDETGGQRVSGYLEKGILRLRKPIADAEESMANQPEAANALAAVKAFQTELQKQSGLLKKEFASTVENPR